MQNNENKKNSYLPKIDAKKNVKNNSQSIMWKQIPKIPKKRSLSNLKTTIKFPNNIKNANEDLFPLNKEVVVRNNKFFKKKEVEPSKVIVKDVIRLSQVNLSLNMIQSLSNVSLINENKFHLKKNRSLESFNLENSQITMRKTGLPINLGRIRQNFFSNKNKTKSSQLTHKDIEKVIELKFNIKSQLKYFISKFNLKNVYPQFIRNNELKKRNFRNKIIDDNKEIIDCDQLIKNFDELKDNSMMLETLNF